MINGVFTEGFFSIIRNNTKYSKFRFFAKQDRIITRLGVLSTGTMLEWTWLVYSQNL